MEQKFNIRQALSVIARIVELGDKKQDEHFYLGLYADQGFDGYRLSLRDELVCLTIEFHNKFNLDYPNQKALELFVAKIQRIESAGNNKV
jgi:hypothetical protein